MALLISNYGIYDLKLMSISTNYLSEGSMFPLISYNASTITNHHTSLKSPDA